jgi:D-psicose/D-tagatose/L-ribulose 3-epimerase
MSPVSAAPVAETTPRGLIVSSIAWEPGENAEVAELLRSEGCAGVELAPTKWRDRPVEASAVDIAEHRTWWQDRGLPVMAFQSLLFGKQELQLFTDAATRRDLLDYLRRIIDLAERFGASTLVFGSPKNRVRGAMSMAEAMEIAVPFFRAVGDHAQSHGTLFCIEPNPPAYGCDFVTTTAEAVELCRITDHAAFRVHGDTGGMTLNGEDPGVAVTMAAPYLAHFHLSEPNLAELGTGGADLVATADALGVIGYEGWLSIEMRSGGTENLERVRRAVRRAKALMSA